MRKITGLILGFVIMSVLVACNTTKYNDIALYSNYNEYNYIDLKEEASVIALVEVIDTLTEKSSKVFSNEFGEIVDYYSYRKVKVKEYYKCNNLENQDNILILEKAALKEKDYYHPENYNSLEQGKEYILFLSPSNVDDTLMIISGDNGVVPLEDLSESSRLDISYKGYIDFMDKTLSREVKDAILRCDEATAVVDTTSSVKYLELTPNDNEEVSLSYYEVGDKLYVEISDEKHQIILETNNEKDVELILEE